MPFPVRIAVVILWVLVASSEAAAQGASRVVVDATGLPLPGATVQVLSGADVVATVSTRPDGSFVIDPAIAGDTLIVSLPGFDSVRVPRDAADRITLAIARSSETTTVVAPLSESSSPASTTLGNTLSATAIERMPSAHMKARESLPLLPSVVRGPDGLMQLGGARAFDTPLVLDGFNVTDPATGLSSINLPVESVRGIEVVRDPMSVSYGGLLGGLVAMQSRPGGDEFKWGVQGVVPRPRLSTPGFGRIEGIFPRVYANGTRGRVSYFTALEYDFERIPVPGVTQGSGPNIVEQSATAFARIDIRHGELQSTTIEALGFPNRPHAEGLSPRREVAATSNLAASDWFAGITHRIVRGMASVITLRLGALAHNTALSPNGEGTTLLSPAGWRSNWFTRLRRTGARYTAAMRWDRTASMAGRAHDLTLDAEIASRRVRDEITETPVDVEDATGVVVRAVRFGPTARVTSEDHNGALSVRDLWHVSPRLQADAGLRVDSSRFGGATPSARAGVSYLLDEEGRTVVKAGFGRFVGALPLAVPAFGGYPWRLDQRFDSTGAESSSLLLQPTAGLLRLPRAVAATFDVERQLRPGLDLQVAFTSRRTSQLATLTVPDASGALTVASTGEGRYRELQLALRRTWAGDQQFFVSYVRSTGRGELNDFATLFASLDAPLLQPGGAARLATDVRHRVLAWGTFDLPWRMVISPVAEWRPGFLYSPVDDRQLYVGSANSLTFPSFFTTDVVVYKTVTVRGRSADLGMQLFNATNHRNPRDVYPVVGTNAFGQFTNSVGPVVRGYMLVKW